MSNTGITTRGLYKDGGFESIGSKAVGNCRNNMDVRRRLKSCSVNSLKKFFQIFSLRKNFPIPNFVEIRGHDFETPCIVTCRNNGYSIKFFGNFVKIVLKMEITSVILTIT